MDFINTYVVAHPWIAYTFAALYMASEALGSYDKVAENSIYQAVKTTLKKLTSIFTTPKE